MTEYLKMREIQGFQPCPLCGETNHMYVSTEDSLERQLKDGKGAALSIECLDCGLQVFEVTECDVSYQHMRSRLQRKWNRLAVRDEEIHASA